MRLRPIAALAAIALVAFSAKAWAGYVKDASKIVKSADWSKMETTSVTLKEFSFTPSTLEFQEGVPYKLVIANKGNEKHYFTAKKFFKAIAARKVQSQDGEVKAPYFNAIEVYPGHYMELYFIPVTKGIYELKCTVQGHASMGMKGQIKIE
jgi:uncharacterized cupredoxin-like copper-binding protein